MKKFIFWLILSAMMVLPLQKVRAQSNADSLYNILSHLQGSVDSTHFLYDFAFHSVGSDTFYHAINYDTSNTIIWRTLYNEMYWSAYSRGFIPHDSIMQENIDSVGTYDTVAIGLFDFAYSTFKDSLLDSLKNGVAFMWNNDSIWDSAGRVVSPFVKNYSHTPPDERQEIFAVAPLSSSSWYNDLYFKIDPKFIFYGAGYNPNNWGTDSLEIDFGDGSGWQLLDPTTIRYYHVSYGYQGKYYIQARVVRHLDLSREVIKYSRSTFYVETTGWVHWPDRKIDSVAGIDAGIYNDCHNSDSVGKVLIYLSGFDMVENRFVPQIYQEMIEMNRLNMLKDYDYTIVVVDWIFSKDNLETQAGRIEHLINIMKSLQRHSSKVEGEQFVLMAESMGGLIGRYALTEMEHLGQDHHTRLFVSYDSPQEGASIPLGLQYLYNWAANRYNHVAKAVNSSYILRHLFSTMSELEQTLHTTGVQQMLLEQDVYKFPSGGGYTFPENPVRTAFLNDLNNLNTTTGGWPAHCKLLGISDGLCDTNNHQVGFLNHIAAPGDAFLSLAMSMKMSIFHHTIMPFFTLSPMQILTSPASSGPVASIGMITYKWSFRHLLISLFHSGPFAASPWQAVNDGTSTLTAIDVKPYDIMPGGCTNFFKYLPGNISDSKWLGLLSYAFKVDTTSGSIYADASLFYVLNFTITGASVLPVWCFIPRFSALAYNTTAIGGMMDNDIYHSPVTTTLSRTNFDVISCEPSNTTIYPRYGQPNGQDFVHISHYSVDRLGVPAHYDLTWMTREMGDINMNLDNMDINRLALYQVADTIRAGMQISPFYYYPNHSNVLTRFNGMWSKEKGFTVESSSANVTFKSGKEIYLEPGFSALQGCRFLAIIDTAADTCGYSYATLGKKGSGEGTIVSDTQETPNNGKVASGVFKIFPNPTSSIWTVQLPDDIQKANIIIYNTLGAEVAIMRNIHTSIFNLSPEEMMLKGGMYFLIIQTDRGQFKQKLIYNP